MHPVTKSLRQHLPTAEETERNIYKDDNTDTSVVEPSQELELLQLRRSTTERRPPDYYHV